MEKIITPVIVILLADLKSVLAKCLSNSALEQLSGIHHIRNAILLCLSLILLHCSKGCLRPRKKVPDLRKT